MEGLTPNDYLQSKISVIVSSSGEGGDEVQGTELDSHANMVVIGSQAFVFNHSGKFCEVKAFSEEANGMTNVPIVDAVIAYDCPYSMKTYILVCRNTLCVPSMRHNLIPPFILREAGLVVKDTPKIHCEDPGVEDHSIHDRESGLRIPLSLRGIFSTFRTRPLTEREIDSIETFPTIFLTPDSHAWDHYCDSYRLNEDAHLDFRGDMVYPPP